MNKIKFLSCAVMAAFFAMGITSCEKENFDTKVDIDTPTIEIPGVTPSEPIKPGAAVVAINPSVVAVINGKISDVTSDATVTYNGEEALKYTTNADGSIDKFEVELAAAYYVEEEDTTLTTTKTVNIPALSAGQAIMVSPTLVISANFEAEEPGTEDPGTGEEPGTGEGEKVSLGLVTEEVEGSAVVVKEAGEFEFDNPTNYYYTDMTGTSGDLTYGTVISNIVVEAAYKDNADVQAILGSYNQSVDDYNITIKGITLWPNTKTCFPIEKIAETKSYIIKEQFETRAITETKAATFNVTDYSYIVSTTPVYYNSGTGHTGHGHAHSTGHGHGHDLGHGNGNAGGGIVWGI